MAVARTTLSDGTGVEVDLVDLGAAVAAVRAPDRRGRCDTVTLGLGERARRDPSRNPFVGVMIGPFANRMVDETGSIVLHGGPDGWCWQQWAMTDTSPTGATFTHGPARVRYDLVEGAIEIRCEATALVDTAFSMTNHTYWNLGGPLARHVLDVAATTHVPVDADLVPVGPPRPLAEPVSLPGDHDTCVMIGGKGRRRHATLRHPPSGRTLDVWSDHPATHIYTGCRIGGGQWIAIEPQHVPNAPRLPWAPPTVVAAGDTYHHHLTFRLGTEPSEESP